MVWKQKSFNPIWHDKLAHDDDDDDDDDELDLVQTLGSGSQRHLLHAHPIVAMRMGTSTFENCPLQKNRNTTPFSTTAIQAGDMTVHRVMAIGVSAR